MPKILNLLSEALYMQAILFSILVILGGAALSVQAGVNSSLQQSWAKSPILASFTSFVVGTLALGLLVILMRVPIPPLTGRFVPWHWTGGLMGAYVVSVMVIIAPKLGATATMTLVLLGQLGISLFLDHYGLVGYAERAITWQRLAGICLVGGGVFLIRRF